MKRILFLIFCLGVLAFVGGGDALAQEEVTSATLFDACGEKGGEFWQGIFESRLGCRTSNEFAVETERSGAYQIRFLVERIVNALKRFLIPLAIIFVAMAGLRLYFLGTEDSKLDDAKNTIYGMLWAFGIFALGINFIDFVIFGQQGEILSEIGDDFLIVNTFGERLVKQMRAMFGWGSSVVGGLAVLFLIIGSIQLMTGGEEALKNAKTRILMSLGGIIAVLAGRQIFSIFTNGKGQIIQPNIDLTIRLMGGWFNFLLGIVSVLSFVALVAGGIRFVAAFGRDEERSAAIRMIIGAAVALVLSFSIWTIVSFVGTSFSPGF